MAEGMCATLSRYVLVILNLLFGITGALLLSLGIWLVANEGAIDTITEEVHITLTQTHLDALGYTLISSGFLLFLIGFCGCCGSIRESAIMLGVYIGFMSVLLVAELGAVVYVAIERSDLENIVRAQLLREVSNSSLANNKSSVDYFQIEFQCCGVDDYTDYKDYSNYNGTGFVVPASCCQVYHRTMPAQPRDIDRCQDEAKNDITKGIELNSKGCFQILIEGLDENSAILIGVMSGIVVLEIIGLLFAVYLCRNRSEYYYYDD